MTEAALTTETGTGTTDAIDPGVSNVTTEEDEETTKTGKTTTLANIRTVSSMLTFLEIGLYLLSVN